MTSKPRSLTGLKTKTLIFNLQHLPLTMCKATTKQSGFRLMNGIAMADIQVSHYQMKRTTYMEECQLV